MKHFFTTTITLLLSLSCLHAQRIHFTDTSNRWTTSEMYYYEPLDEWVYHYSTFKLRDTIYNDTLTYAISDGPSSSLIIAEDTVSGKIHCLKISDTGIITFTLYDYNAMPGDTLYIPELYSSTGGFVAHICIEKYDEISVGSIPYRAFQMQRADNFSTYVVIEGVGALTGPIGPLLEISEYGPPGLTCFEHRDERPEYSALFSNNCYLSIDDPGALKLGISLFPNPTSELLHVSLAQSTERFQFAAHDLLGRQVCEGQIKSEATLDISTWQSGMYILRIKDGKGNTTAERFVKQ